MRKGVLLFVVFILSSFTYSQQEDIHNFTLTHEIKTTSVKSQGKSGTCWAFAATSFLEAELIRLGYGEVDLSEMFTVRHKLLSMANNYIKYHGMSNFGEGGQAHDLMNVISRYGLVPEAAYSGKNIGLEIHNHGEMNAVLTGILDGVLKKKSGKLTPRWKEVLESTLNIYLGSPPEKFSYDGKEYTPQSFKKKLGFDTENYVEITCYTDAPFYDKFNLPLPDNWTNNEYYNVPIEVLMKIIDSSINNGYSVCWDGDAGSDNFYRKEGYAVVPIINEDEVKEPEKEKQINQQMRQEAFENLDVTDDHLMHLVGIAKNQNGTKFYYTKNSWGTKDKKYNGYWYMSENYLRLKTVAIMVHKDAIPIEIKVKMDI